MTTSATNKKKSQSQLRLLTSRLDAVVTRLETNKAKLSKLQVTVDQGEREAQQILVALKELGLP